MNSSEIQAALRSKHAEDVYVDECKDGPSQSGSHSRLDGWAMARSWNKPHVYGYEIKVSRSDFVRDEKWQSYLPLCNSLYFVCPPKLIQPEEVPGDVGLLWCHGTRLLSKKKAAYRNVVIPDSLWRYILMCRAKIGPSNFNTTEGERPADYWSRWLKQREEDREIGRRASRGLAQLYTKRVEFVRRENDRLRKENEVLAATKAVAEKIGVSNWDDEESITRKLNKLRELVPAQLLYEAEGLAERLSKLVENLRKATS